MRWGVEDHCQERSERQRGWCEPPPCVPGKKGSNLFYMIPLERWNTEHRFDFHSKRIPGDNRLSSLIGPMERTVSRSVPVCSGLAAQKQ